MLKKLRVKFICINMVMVTVMLGVIFGLVFHFTRQSLETESLRMMQSISASPVELGRPGDRQEDVQIPYFVVQINKFGSILATGGGYYDLSDEEFLLEIIQSAMSAEQETGELEAYQLRFLRSSTPSGEKLVFADTSTEKTTLNNLMTICAGIGAVAFLAFFGISLLLSVWAVKPVDQAWNQQKQFVADASHELKTPLTVILTNAELLQSEDYDDAQRSEFTGHILIMARQMRTLVERLLTLARVDNGAAQTVMGPVDLSELTADGLLPFEPVFFERGLMLQSQIQPGLQVKGSPSHLRQVLDILLDNAMKYAAPESEVWVTLRRQGNHVLLAVANPGDAITPEDLKNIFKRFYRVDKARSRDGSYGLGLSIAESIVTEHRGRIWAQSENGINTFFVQIPLL